MIPYSKAIAVKYVLYIEVNMLKFSEFDRFWATKLWLNKILAEATKQRWFRGYFFYAEKYENEYTPNH